MRLILVFCLLFSFNSLLSQVDYNEFVKGIPMTCTRNDSASIVRTQQILDSLNQYEITEGRQLFNTHYAIMYNFRFWKWYDEDDMRKSMSYYEKNWNEFKDMDALSNLTGYASIGECDEAIMYYELYNKHLIERNKEVNYKEGYLLYKRCRENEQILR